MQDNGITHRFNEEILMTTVIFQMLSAQPEDHLMVKHTNPEISNCLYPHGVIIISHQ